MNSCVWSLRREFFDKKTTDDILVFVNTPIHTIASMRGVPGVDMYIEARLNKVGIRSVQDLVNLYGSHRKTHRMRATVTMKKYLDKLGISPLKRDIVILALVTHSSEREFRMMKTKPTIL